MEFGGNSHCCFVLNCDAGKVHYYNNEKCIKTYDRIVVHKRYWFALHLCGYLYGNHYRIVKTPDAVTALHK